MIIRMMVEAVRWDNLSMLLGTVSLPRFLGGDKPGSFTNAVLSQLSKRAATA
jgi:hypothetical protein